MDEARDTLDVISLILELVKEAEELRSYVNDKVENILVRVNDLSAHYIKPRHKRKSTRPTKYIYAQSDEQSEEDIEINDSTINYASDSETQSSGNNEEEACSTQSSHSSSQKQPNTPKRVKTANDVSNDEIRPFPCEYCDKSYGWQMSLQRHIKESHDESMKFECRSCSKIFTRRYLLSKHELTHRC